MSMNPCPRCGGLMHCICHSTYKTTPPPALPSYSQRISELENEIERLRARVAVLEQALGLLTTLAPKMEIDKSDPLGMARNIEATVRAALEAKP